MNALRHVDWVRLHDFAVDLHDCGALAELPARLLAGLQRLIPSDAAALQDDRGGLRRIPWLYDHQSWQPDAPASPGVIDDTGAHAELGVRMMTPGDPPFHLLREVFFEVSADRHPHTDFFRRTGNGRALRLSDVMSTRALRRTRLYQEISRRTGINWQLSFFQTLPAGHTLMVVLCRQAFDFSAREKELLEVARPHIVAAWSRAWEKHREERRWQRLAGRIGGTMPVWPTTGRLDDASGARALRRLGLSPREADVLYWVAQGKTNAEAGIILGVKPNTAKHYVERLLAKLGCENRTAAARTAMEVLGK